jgi:Antibiotic biosynthesis monooxygenase
MREGQKIALVARYIGSSIKRGCARATASAMAPETGYAQQHSLVADDAPLTPNLGDALRHAAGFEKVWLGRDTYLDRVPGFLEFHLLKGPEAEDYTLYSSHSVWQSKRAFAL